MVFVRICGFGEEGRTSGLGVGKVVGDFVGVFACFCNYFGRVLVDIDAFGLFLLYSD